MSRKFLLILGLTVFLLLLAGCNSDKTDTDSNKEKNMSSEDEYEIRDIRMGINDSGKFTVIGKLKNKGIKKEYTEILIPCYDKNGAELEKAFDSSENIDSGGEWKFHAVYSGDGIPAVCRPEAVEVITY